MKKTILFVLMCMTLFAFDNVYASSYEKYEVGEAIKYDPVADAICETGNTCFTWYSIKESGYSDKNLSMILDHNLGEKTALISDVTAVFQEQLVPDAANSYLQNLTSNWKYQGRLITKQEIMDILGVSSLTGNVSIENYNWLSSPDSYWVDAISKGYSWTISNGVLTNTYIAYNKNLTKCYVRPVIDIEKTNITNKTIITTDNNILISSIPSTIDKISKVEVSEFSKDSDIYRRLQEIFSDKKSIIAYNFNLYNENNNLVEPESKVTVNIKLPTDMNYDKIRLWYIADDFSKQELEYSIHDNILSFETDHFSTYVLTEDKEEEIVQIADTSFNTMKLGITIGLVILVLGIMVIVQTLLKDKKKNQ